MSSPGGTTLRRLGPGPGGLRGVRPPSAHQSGKESLGALPSLPGTRRGTVGRKPGHGCAGQLNPDPVLVALPPQHLQLWRAERVGGKRETLVFTKRPEFYTEATEFQEEDSSS